MRRFRSICAVPTLCAIGVSFAFGVSAAELHFDQLPTGKIVGELSNGKGASGLKGGTVYIHGFNPDLSMDDNAAVIFDSSNPTGGDDDLGTPNEDFGGPGVDDRADPNSGGKAGSPYENDMPLGNVLIINEPEGLVDTNGNGDIDPDDANVVDPDDDDQKGQFFELDFSGIKGGKTVTINTISYMDVEQVEGEDGTSVYLMGPDFPAPKMLTLHPTGDNGVYTQDIGIEGVEIMRIVMGGSGAITGVTLEEDPERPCWVTTGGFFNAGVVSGPKQCTFGGNVGPPPSGAFEVNFHTDGPDTGAEEGDKFHTNDIEAVRCEDEVEGGPQQPGANKGLVVDTLYFECTGRFNNDDGYTCDGYLQDAGEPAGKRGNGYDRISMVIYDGQGSEVARCEGDLDGGNVQIHPPVPNN
ncbi:hypothetical protein [Ferrimonas balearica]|uniref:hypothetical protein n=1 Tax=Ferrimonas balearica TaxID=44012 RepID=UPI001C993D04|nr:hypothetical protein [Ferrimonas balearica]MBY5991600.1 hypothetical protein [Ferrimonas balearica]